MELVETQFGIVEKSKYVPTNKKENVGKVF